MLRITECLGYTVAFDRESLGLGKGTSVEAYLSSIIRQRHSKGHLAEGACHVAALRSHSDSGLDDGEEGRSTVLRQYYYCAIALADLGE